MMQDEYQPTSQSDSFPEEPPEWTENRQGFPRSGQKLLGRYEISQVKEGGFGIVFYVTDLQINQNYAVKTYKPEIATTKGAELFKAEAGFWVNLKPHPNIVTAYFVEEIQDQPYLFMEYVAGQPERSVTSLRDWLRHGRLDVRQAIHFAYQLCLGMEFINREKEVVHGDLKPENLLIDAQKVLKITDFGLAHRIEVKDGKFARAEASTRAYAPPEYFFHQPVDSRWDIFAFGVILHEMLTGKLPYPFELNRNPTVQLQQLSDFHKQEGMRKQNDALYYKGIFNTHSSSELSLELGDFLTACLQDLPGSRARNFKQIRQMMEHRFARYLPVASNKQPSGFTLDTPVANTSPSLTDLRGKRTLSLK